MLDHVDYILSPSLLFVILSVIVSLCHVLSHYVLYSCVGVLILI